MSDTSVLFTCLYSFCLFQSTGLNWAWICSNSHAGLKKNLSLQLTKVNSAADQDPLRLSCTVTCLYTVCQTNLET